MPSPEEHFENKLVILGLMRENFHHFQVTGARLGLDLEVVEASTGLTSSEVQAILGELISIKLAAPQANTSRPIAVEDGRVEITGEGLAHLHQVETGRAHEVFRTKVASEAAAAQRSQIKDESRQANMEPDEYRSGPAGFRPNA